MVEHFQKPFNFFFMEYREALAIFGLFIILYMF